MRLEGTVAIMSGGARGIGAAEARAFGPHGAHVIIDDLLDEQGRALASELAHGADRLSRRGERNRLRRGHPDLGDG